MPEPRRGLDRLAGWDIDRTWLSTPRIPVAVNTDDYTSPPVLTGDDENLAYSRENVASFPILPQESEFIQSLIAGLERELRLPHEAADAFARAAVKRMPDHRRFLNLVFGHSIRGDDQAFVDFYIEAAKAHARELEAVYDPGAYELARIEQERQRQLPSEPELWNNRVDKRESPQAFYQRVWGPYSGLVYRDDVEARDPSLMVRLAKEASGKDPRPDVRPPPASQRAFDLLAKLAKDSPAALKLKRTIGTRRRVSRSRSRERHP